MSKLIALINQRIVESFEDNYQLIQSLVSPAIGIKLNTVHTKFNFLNNLLNNKHTVNSKIGGLPYINKNFVWPEVNNKPLTFLCQINLKDITKYNTDLPQTGVLYFFVANSEIQTYREAESDIKVIYQSNCDSCITQPTDIPVLQEYKIKFYEYYTIPSYQEKRILDHNFDFEILNDLNDLEEDIKELCRAGETFFNHHMLGDPNAIQGSVRVFWGSKYSNPADFHYEKIGEEAIKYQNIGEDFILLLQIDLEDNRIELPNYGDNCLYFGVHKDDLKKLNFNNVKLIIQST